MDQLLVSETKTEVIYPRFHSNQRTEFHFQKDQLLDADVRVGNLGCVLTGANAGFTLNNGVTSIIKNMYLLNGSDQIDVVLELNELSAFYNIRNKNYDNISYKSALTGQNCGYYLPEASPAGVVGDGVVNYANDLVLATQNATTTFYGLIHLNAFFDFLRKAKTLNTKVFNNLRLVIEYHSNPAQMFGGATNGITAVNMISPQMYVDRMVNVSPDVIPSDFVVEYDSTELERLTVSTGTSFNDRVNAFNGKFLSKCLLINKHPGDDASQANDIVKGNSSHLEAGENLMVQVNKKNLFDFEGIDNPARKQQKLIDIWEDVNITPCSWQLDVSQPNLGNLVSADSKFDYLGGRLSYGGFLVGERISEMKISFKRTNADSLQIYFYGEVGKIITVAGGKYTMAYL